MAQKDDDSELLPKQLLAWLQGIGTLAAALVVIFALFGLDDQTAKLLAGGVAILLAAGSAAVYGYRRRRTKRLTIKDNVEPLAPSAAFRGLLPFEEGDQLPGRAYDV